MTPHLYLTRMPRFSKDEPEIVAVPIAHETPIYITLDTAALTGRLFNMRRRLDKRFPSHMTDWHRTPGAARVQLATKIRAQLKEARQREPKIWRRAKQEAAANRATIARLEKQLAGVRS